MPSGTDSESWPSLGLHMALPSVADCWAPAGRTAHACGEAVSREAGLSPPWLRASSMLKFSPRLGGCSKILKAVGQFGSSFSVVEAMRSSKDCLRFQNPFCFAGLLFRVSRETVKEVGPGSMRYCGWTDGNVSVQLSLRGPSLGNSICHSEEQKACGCRQQGRGLRIQIYPSHAVRPEDTYLTSLGHP